MSFPAVLPKSAVAALLLGVAPVGSGPGAGPAAAAEPQQGRLFAVIKVADNALVDTPVMVSAVAGGAIVAQTEILLVKAPNQASALLDRLAPGLYDVRVEGDGLVTEVKRGAQVFAQQDGHLQFVVRPGQGLHVVEYAEGGLAREEVAVRLMRLEQSLSGIQAELATLKEARSPAP